LNIFKKWAVVGFKDETGIGRMCQDIRSVLGIGKHMVAPSERLASKNNFLDSEYLMTESLSMDELCHQLKGLIGIICIERIHWHKLLIKAAKSLGLKIICVPMWEWFRGTDQDWKIVDRFLCPNLKSLGILKSYGYNNAFIINWTLDISSLPHRKVEGSAHTFIHSVGLIDHDDRKGTKLVIEAFKRVKKTNLKLILRIQKPSNLQKIDNRIEILTGNLEKPSELYKEGQVAIQPSRMEGLGFMVLEPICCGLPVITTNGAPMNEYVQNKNLLIKTNFFKRKAFAYKSAGIKQAFLTNPRINDLTKKINWCSENDLSSISEANRNWALEQFDTNKLRKEWKEALTF
jgi:glycosyltransferase involved in cell wall biosynthesis